MTEVLVWLAIFLFLFGMFIMACATCIAILLITFADSSTDSERRP